MQAGRKKEKHSGKKGIKEILLVCQQEESKKGNIQEGRKGEKERSDQCENRMKERNGKQRFLKERDDVNKLLFF